MFAPLLPRYLPRYFAPLISRYSDVDAGLSPSYGWIKSIFTHEMYPGGPTLDFLHADWADLLDDKSCTGLEQIEWNANSNFNLNSSIAAATDLIPYNLAFLPQNIADDANGCNTYAVIDNHKKYGLWQDF